MYNELWSLLVVVCLGNCEAGIQDHGLTAADCWQEYGMYTELLGTTQELAGLIQYDCVQESEIREYRFIPDYVMLREIDSETVYKF